MDPTRSQISKEHQECLLCFDTYSETKNKSSDSFPFLQELFPGAVRCQTLENQLKQVFILRRLLDIPSSWCEEVLKGGQYRGKEYEFDETNNESYHPDSWFWVCTSCLTQTVIKALKIHHQILCLEGEMRQLKDKLKVTMRQRWDNERRNGRIDDAIREMVCSDVHENESGDNWCSNNLETEVVQDQKTTKRGRPKGSIRRKIFDMAVIDRSVKVKGDIQGGRMEEDEYGNNMKISPDKEKRRRGRPKGSVGKMKIIQGSFKNEDDDQNHSSCSNSKRDDPDCGDGEEVEEQIDDRQIRYQDSSNRFSISMPIKRKRPRGSFRSDMKSKEPNIRSTDMDDDYGSSSSSSSEDRDPDWGDGEVELEEQTDEEEIKGEDQDASSDLLSIPAPLLQRKRGRPKGSKTSVTPIKRKRPSTFLKRCPKCPAKYHLSESLQLHLEAHSKSIENDNQFACTICSFPSLNEEELKLHEKRKHSNWKKPKAAVGHSCSLCEYKIGKLRLLREHYLQKHKENSDLDQLLPKECSTCGKFYPDTEALTLHQELVHPMGKVMDKPIQCDQCEQQFASRVDLTSHIKNTHSRVNRHVCDECGAGFQFLSRLMHHKIKHNVDKREWVCHLCGVDYPYERTLQTHYKKVHPDHDQNQGKSEVGGEEQFKCKYCDLTSPFSVVISRHLATHKKELGHVCGICSKCYFNAQGLKRHVRINHPVTDEKMECPYCKKEFPNMEYLKSHIKHYCKLKHLEQANADDGISPTTSSTIAQCDAPEVKFEEQGWP